MREKKFEITVDRRTSKMIAQVVQKEIETSRNKNMKVYQLAERCERQYAQITRYMNKGVPCNAPWTNAADYFVPMTEWMVDAIHARAMRVLFSQEPYMEARGVEAADVEKASGVTDFVDGAFRETIKLYENANYFIKQMIKLPMAIMRYDVEQEFDRKFGIETANTFINEATGETADLLQDDPESFEKSLNLVSDGFQPAGTREVFTTEDVKIVDGPQLEYINFRDYVWSPNAKRSKRPHWEGNRFWLTINDMRMKVQQDRFIKESVKMVEQQNANAEAQGVERVIAHRAALRECYHWYGRLPFNSQKEIDFEDPEAIEQEVYCVIDYKAIETLSISHWYHDRHPTEDRVYIRGMYEETEQFWGRSLCQKLWNTQRELNTLHNTIMNNANIAMQKIFVKKRSLTGEDWERPEVFPGAIWEEQTPGDIRVLNVGDVAAVGFELEQSLLNFAERISNISIFQTGTARDRGGQKTKGEVDLTIAEGNIGLDNFIQRVHIVLRKIAAWTVDYYHEDMPPGLERRIRGEDGALVFPTDENIGQFTDKDVQRYWTSDDLAGQFDFVWAGTTLSANKQLQVQLANDMFDRFLPQPMIAGSLLHTWEILKKNLVAKGHKDWQKFLPKREEIIQEMQNIEERAALKSKQRANERIIDRASDRLNSLQSIQAAAGQGQGGGNRSQ